MIQTITDAAQEVVGAPRASGDDPSLVENASDSFACSPRERG